MKGSLPDFLLDYRHSGIFIIDPLGRIYQTKYRFVKMNINTDFIPVETSTTTMTSTSLSTTSEMATKTSSMTSVLTTETNSNEFPAGQRREKIIEGLSELEKDIFLISLSALCLVLMALLWTICLKWRKSKRQRLREFNTLAEGSSQSLFNSSKMD